MAIRWTRGSSLLSLLLVALCLAFVAAFACRGMVRDGVNRANYERIELGMAQAEVEAIMRGRPGVELPWLDLEDIAFDERPLLLMHSPPEKAQIWQSNAHQLTVLYDASGRVVSKYYARHPEIGVFERVFDWLGI